MTRRGDIVRPPGGYGGGHHGAPSAPFNPDGGRVWWRCHTELTATIRGQYVGAFLEVATASHIDDGQHIPTATRWHGVI